MDPLLLVIPGVGEVARGEALARRLRALKGWRVEVAERLVEVPLDGVRALVMLRAPTGMERKWIEQRPPGVRLFINQVPADGWVPSGIVHWTPWRLLHPAWMVLGGEIARRRSDLTWLEWEQGRPGDEAGTISGWIEAELPLIARWIGGVGELEQVNVEQSTDVALKARLALRGGVTLSLDVDLSRRQERDSLCRVRLGDETWTAWSRTGRDELLIEGGAAGERRLKLEQETPDPYLLRFVAAALHGRPGEVLRDEARAASLELARRLELSWERRASRRAAVGEVLLVKPPRYRASDDVVILPPLGLARLQATLGREGFRTRIADRDDATEASASRQVTPFCDDPRVDAWLGGGEDAELDEVSRELVDGLDIASDTRVVGFNVTDVYRRVQANLVAAMARELRRRVRDGSGGQKIATVVGGDFEAVNADFLLGTGEDREPLVDFAVFGDGEEALLGLVQALAWKDRPLERVPGLWFRKGAARHEGRRGRVRFSERPLPDFTGVPFERYRRGMSPELQAVLAAEEPALAAQAHAPLHYLPYYFVNGCSGKCVFCSWGTWLDMQDPKKSVAEMVELSKRWGTDSFYLLNTAVNLSYKSLARFVDALLQSGAKLKWTDSARPHILDADLAQGMAEAGCVMLSYGVESGSDAVLKRMQKGFTAAQAGAALEAAHAAGILNRVNLIAGFFHEGEADVAATERFVHEHHQAMDVIGCFQGFYLFDGMDLDAETLGIQLRTGGQRGWDTLSMGQRTRTYDELGPGGLAWEDKRSQIDESWARVKAALDAHGVFARDKIDDYDVFHLARLFPDKARRKRYLLASAARQLELERGGES